MKYFHNVCFKSIEDALESIKRINDIGISCSLSHLPVIKNNPWSIEREVSTYFRMLQKISEGPYDCDVTLKLHQLGIYSTRGITKESVKRIINRAYALNNFVWVDMERRETVSATIELCQELYKLYPANFGVCLQAYLKRTKNDMRDLHSIPVRLVKGFYKDHDYNSWKEVTANYREIMFYILTHNSRPAIATHDLELIDEAKDYIVKCNIKEKTEFEFFSGVRDDLARQLVKEGFRVRLYLPFGNAWRFVVNGFKTFDLWHQIERMLGFTPWP